MEIGSVFVLYNPDQQIIESLQHVARLKIKICFVDNSPTPRDDYPFETISNYNRGGIAGAFNLGVSSLAKSGCDFIFTFDQDSVLPDGFFENMQEFIEENSAEIVCPNFFDTNSKTFGKFLTLKKITYTTKPIKTTTFTISSGMGFSLSSLKKIGPFDEDLVIDHVDTDICLKALSASIPIFVNRRICLNHKIGERIKRNFMGVTIKPNNHNPTRRYYIARNGTYLAIKHAKKYPAYFLVNVLRIAHELVGIFIYENQKKEKTLRIIQGVKDSLKGRLGPL